MGACTMLRLPRSPAPARPGGMFAISPSSQARFIFPTSPPVRPNTPLQHTYTEPARTLCEESPVYSTVLQAPPVLKKSSVQVCVVHSCV